MAYITAISAISSLSWPNSSKANWYPAMSASHTYILSSAGLTPDTPELFTKFLGHTTCWQAATHILLNFTQEPALLTWNTAQADSLSSNFISPERMMQTLFIALMVLILKSWLKSSSCFLHITNTSVVAVLLDVVQIFNNVHFAANLHISDCHGHFYSFAFSMECEHPESSSTGVDCNDS